jgi:DNA (cytosine-5)-methyltransferase 1
MTDHVPQAKRRLRDALALQSDSGELVPGPRLLDLFCCQGGAAMGYYRAGFQVVGVDIGPQDRYPFPMAVADAVEYARDRGEAFEAIHASPPCQAYSAAQRLRGNEHPDLIATTREALEATGLPYVIENVVDAREHLRDPVMLCGAMFPELRVYRHRLFETNWPLTVPLHPQHVAPQVKMGRALAPGEWVQAVGNFSGVQEARDAMGCQWMSRDGLRECIPPAYTEWVGTQLAHYLALAAEVAA